jgi:hypothetical protein
LVATIGELSCNCLNNVSTGQRDAAASGSAYYWPSADVLRGGAAGEDGARK